MTRGANSHSALIKESFLFTFIQFHGRLLLGPRPTIFRMNWPKWLSIQFNPIQSNGGCDGCGGGCCRSFDHLSTCVRSNPTNSLSRASKSRVHPGDRRRDRRRYRRGALTNQLIDYIFFTTWRIGRHTFDLNPRHSPDSRGDPWGWLPNHYVTKPFQPGALHKGRRGVPVVPVVAQETSGVLRKGRSCFWTLLQVRHVAINWYWIWWIWWFLHRGIMRCPSCSVGRALQGTSHRTLCGIRVMWWNININY